MDSLWLKFILFITSYALLIFLFNKGMRKWFKVKKKKLFSYHHLNGKHKKIDWMIRITFVILIFVGGFYNATLPPLDRMWFLETHILLFVFVLLSETVRAIMEKRYAENRNDYKFTISQLAFLSFSLLLIFSTDFFWVFK
jgi:formate hydrogenlyase subunit 3/multisubunit Na+/H+ antiporter MnhD subunit